MPDESEKFKAQDERTLALHRTLRKTMQELGYTYATGTYRGVDNASMRFSGEYERVVIDVSVVPKQEGE